MNQEGNKSPLSCFLLDVFGFCELQYAVQCYKEILVLGENIGVMGML